MRMMPIHAKYFTGHQCDKDIIDQLRTEAHAGLEYTLELKRKLEDREALITMLVRGFMAEEKLRMYEKDSDDVPF